MNDDEFNKNFDEIEKFKIETMIELLKTKETIEKSINALGESIHGRYFVGADIQDDKEVVMYTESGHDWDLDEWHYDMEGNHLND